MNFFVNSTRKNTGKDQSQSKSGHRAAVGGMNHILVGLLTCGKFNGHRVQASQAVDESISPNPVPGGATSRTTERRSSTIIGQGMAGPKNSKSWTRLATRSGPDWHIQADRAIPPGGSALSKAGGPLNNGNARHDAPANANKVIAE